MLCGYGYSEIVVKRVLLAAPRGYCAGVERAVETVERALELYGAPVFVRKQIVHNSYVVDELTRSGAVFVDSVADVPEGELVVFSAHGVAPAVRAGAATRSLRTIDATCPLVTKVHMEAKRYAADGYTVVLVGHAGHEEVEGTTGEAPQSIVLVESVADAERLEVEDPERIAYVTRRRSRSTRPARSSPSCAAVSRLYTGRRRKTSATRRPTVSRRSKNCSATSSSCW